MIVKISQTASNIKQTFDIESDVFYFQGKVGQFSRFQPITLSNKDTKMKGVYHLSKWINYIPFRWLFRKENHTKIFYLYKNENIYGSIMFSQRGFMKSFHVITLNSGEIFHCYCRAKGLKRIARRNLTLVGTFVYLLSLYAHFIEWFQITVILFVCAF